MFEAEHPFAANNVHVRSGRKERPSVVAKKGIKFKVHGITPSRVLGSCRVRGCFDICRAYGGSECFGKWI